MAREHDGRTRRAVALVAFGGALATAAIGSVSCGSTNKTPVPATGAPITIGVTIALTKGLAGTGLPLQHAVRVAEQQLNSYGGILGRPVTFHVLDDTTDDGPILQGNVQKLMDEGALAILGPIGSGQVKAVADPTKPGPFNTFQRKVIEISGTATSVELTTLQPATDRYFFRTVPNDKLQAKALAIFATQGPGPVDGGVQTPVDAGPEAGDAGKTPDLSGACKRMSILHNDDAYGNPFAAALVTEFATRGGQVVTNRAVPGDVKANYTDELNEILAARPDCLTFIVYDPVGDEILREVKAAQKSNPSVLPPGFFSIGTDGTYTPQFINNGRSNPADSTLPTVVEGAYGTNPDPNPDIPQYGGFKNLYLAQFSLEESQADLAGQVVNFYDAAILAALAIQRAGTTTDPVKIRNALFEVSRPGGRTFGPAELGGALDDLRNGLDIDYNGASGDCDFDENGDVIANYIVWHVENGQFVTLQHIPAQVLR